MENSLVDSTAQVNVALHIVQLGETIDLAQLRVVGDLQRGVGAVDALQEGEREVGQLAVVIHDHAAGPGQVRGAEGLEQVAVETEDGGHVGQAGHADGGAVTEAEEGARLQVGEHGLLALNHVIGPDADAADLGDVHADLGQEFVVADVETEDFGGLVQAVQRSDLGVDQRDAASLLDAGGAKVEGVQRAKTFEGHVAGRGQARHAQGGEVHERGEVEVANRLQ